MSSETRHAPISITPFHVAGVIFLLAGLVLAIYHGLAQFDVVPALAWVSWSHIHYVTIGAFTQLIFGMMPQLTAHRLDRPKPSKWYTWLNFVGLNGAFLLLWYGRGWANTLAFDVGLYAIFLLTAGLLFTVLRMALRSDGEKAWDAMVGQYLLSTFVFLWGITYAYGLYAHPWDVPGGWLGLREGHVHANGWGFLGLTAIATLYVLFPRIVEVDLHSERLRNYSFWFLFGGIFPLITGPWLGMGRTITMSGILLFGTGYAMFLYNLVRTYLQGTRSGLALSVLVAQFWILAPAGFAPFVIFGVDWVEPAWIEQGALHWFFMGWALPIALAGVVLFFRNLGCGGRLGLADRADPDDLLPDGTVPTDVISRWMVVVWNVAIVAVGFGFFYQDAAVSTYLFGGGYTVLGLLWFHHVVRAVMLRRGLRAQAASA